MRKIVSLQRQDSAVGFYRCIQPMRFLKREGICQETRILPWTGDIDNGIQKLRWQDRLYMEITRGATAFITDMIWQDDDFLKILNIRKWSKAKWIIDIDDNVMGITPDNPNYANIKQVLPKMQRSLQFADGITVSVPLLKELYKSLNDHIFVNPNGIDFSLWNSYKPKSHKGIRIGWRGAAGHETDRAIIEPAIKKIILNYPGTTFVVFQQIDPHYDFPYEWQPFVPFRGTADPSNPTEYEKGTSYYDTLARLNLDIAVVPLIDNGYNRCKSNLAYLEFSALGIPSVLSPVENQKNMKALYAATNYQWYDQLSKLIESKLLRREIGTAANLFIKENYDMKKLVHPLAKWVDNLSYKDIEPDSF